MPAKSTPPKQRRRKFANQSARAKWQQQLTENRTGRGKTSKPGREPIGALSSANSISADPHARTKSLGEPVPQVTRHM